MICGTDTGVGKTWVGVRTLAALRALGVRVAASKPIESGVRTDGIDGQPADALALAQAVDRPLDEVCRWQLPEPIAPARELERLGIEVSDDDLVGAIAAAARDADVLWVETAGGVASPLTPTRCSGDVPALLGAPAVLVVPDTLGAIHHATVSAHWLASRGATLAAILLNDRGDRDPTRQNARWIGEACPDVPVVASTDELARLLAAAVR